MNGLWGTLAVGLFATDGGLFYGGGFAKLGIQLLGVVSVAAWVLVTMTIIFTIIKKTIGLRVSEKEELDGLDIHEHGLTSAMPFVLGVWFAVATHSLVPLLLAGVLGGMIAAPQLCGLLDTILRSLRDEPGFWWTTYRRAWKRNAKASLLPGAIGGLLLAMQIFTAFHYDISVGVVPGALLAVGLFLLLGLAEFLFAQVALLEMPFAGMLKNSLFLFLGYLPRAALGVLWQFVYWIVILLLWPISGFALLITGFWLPALLTMQAIYPVLDKAFDLERQIKAKRDAELDS